MGGWGVGGRGADFLLLAITAVELAVLLWLSREGGRGLGATDWVYICSNLLVLVIALVRRPAHVQDRSIAAAVAVVISYTYSYAQVALLQLEPEVGWVLWPAVGAVIVLIGAVWSLVSLISLGRFFGVRPALRGLSTRGTYRIVRHPLYLAYLIQDVGYNLAEGSTWTLAVVVVGWGSLVYRIRAEERVLSQSPDWPGFAARVRYRLLPGIW